MSRSINISIWAFRALFKRDIKHSFARGSEALTAIFFFIVAVSFFAFAFGGEEVLLRKASVGILWVGAVLAALLSLEGFYHWDAEDGTFDLLLISSVSPIMIVFSKVLAHWVISGLPLVLVSILLSQMLFLPLSALSVFVPALLLGTLYISILGGMGAMLTFGTRRPGMLLLLLVLPLYIPMLLLGGMAMEAELASLPAKPYLLLQLSMVIAAFPLMSGAGAVFLKMYMRS